MERGGVLSCRPPSQAKPDGVGRRVLLTESERQSDLGCIWPKHPVELESPMHRLGATGALVTVTVGEVHGKLQPRPLA